MVEGSVDRIEELTLEVESLQKQVDGKIESARDKTLTEVSRSMMGGSSTDAASSKVRTNVSVCRTLKGHFGKVYGLAWGPDSSKGRPRLLSVSNGGQMILWDPNSTVKVEALRCSTPFVMSCALSPDGRFAASGGLDNICSLYRMGTSGNQVGGGGSTGYRASQSGGGGPVRKADVELVGHEGYISGCVFFSDESLHQHKVVTSSGDSYCRQWDMERGVTVATYGDHALDVMALCVLPSGGELVTVSIDGTARVWDLRTTNGCVQVFHGHDGDVNAVAPWTNQGFVTGGGDGTVRLWDLRSHAQLRKLPSNTTNQSSAVVEVTSVASSKSGRTVFSGRANGTVTTYDVLAPTDKVQQTLANHDGKVSCLGIAPDGSALATGSWDHTVKIWA